MFRFFLFFMLGTLSAQAYEWNDPTGGKGFLPWAWEDELKPTLVKSIDKTGLIILASGTVSTVATAQFDRKIYHYNEKHPILFGEETADHIGRVGDGMVGVGIAAAQFFFDQENGIKHIKALILSTASHLTMSAAFNRDRPNEGSKDRTSAFPSGHAAAAFVAAGSLAYSYGWAAGVPAYAVASAISIARVRSGRHWASDIVAGAFLGSFWARASFAEDEEDDSTVWAPTPVDDGMMISWMKSF